MLATKLTVISGESTWQALHSSGAMSAVCDTYPIVRVERGLQMSLLSNGDVEKLRASLASRRYASSTSTHGYYHYPARFSPEIARSVIECFSDRADWILDPFMGGG